MSLLDREVPFYPFVSHQSCMIWKCVSFSVLDSRCFRVHWNIAIHIDR